MSETTEATDEAVDVDRIEVGEKPFRFIPKTTTGRVLLGIYLVAFVAVGLSVFGFVFAEPDMLGPMAAPALWAYLWYAVMNVVLLGTYVYLFKPWAESAERFVAEEGAARTESTTQHSQPGEAVAEGGGD